MAATPVDVGWREFPAFTETTAARLCGKLSIAERRSKVLWSFVQCGAVWLSVCIDVDDNQTSIQEDRAPPIVPHPPQGIDPLKPYTDIFLLATKLWDVCLHFSSTEIGQKLWLQLRKMSNLLIYMS